MRMDKLTLLLVGALVCAPAFTACQDEPEPVTEETPPDTGSSSDEDPKLPDDLGKSWFDLPEEDRWGMRWMLGDDPTLRGPGEYEFQVPADGKEFTFWFPDCNMWLLYADLMGLIYYSDNSMELQKEVEYTTVDNNEVKIKIGANPLDCPREMVFVFCNTRGARASYIFHQEGAPALRHDETLCWKSHDCRFFASGKKESPVYTAYLPYSATEFLLECLNGKVLDTVEVEENDGAEFSMEGGTLAVKLGENTSDGIRRYHLTVSAGNASSRFDIVQMNDGHRNYLPVDDIFMDMPEMMLAGANTTWKGQAVFEVSPFGEELDIRILNYTSFEGLYVEVNGSGSPLDGGVRIKNGDSEYWGTPLFETISQKNYYLEQDEANDFLNTKNFDELKISPNYTNGEKVIEVLYKYENLNSLWSYSTVSLIFIQPPMKESGNSCDVI